MNYNFKYYRLLYSLFAVISLTLVVMYNISIKSILLFRPVLLEVVLSVAGIVTAVFMMILFAKKFFVSITGVKVFTESNNVQPLCQTSFYKYVRHPLYTATLLLVCSIFFLQPQLNNLISCLSITVYTLAGISFEERKLVKFFGDVYVQYKIKTPKLIPKFFNNK